MAGGTRLQSRQVLSFAPDNVPQRPALRTHQLSAGLVSVQPKRRCARWSPRCPTTSARGWRSPRRTRAQVERRRHSKLLEPALQRAPDNPALLRAAAEVHLASNNPAKAAEFYERANALDKTNVEGRLRLARPRSRQAGIRRARSRTSRPSSAANPSMQAADLALISAHLHGTRNGQGACGRRRVRKEAAGESARVQRQGRHLCFEARFQGRARNLRRGAETRPELQRRGAESGPARSHGAKLRRRAQALRTDARQ